MNFTLLFGMNSESPIWGMILVYLIVGLIGFAICYIHRYFVFAVMPLFLCLAYFMFLNLPLSYLAPTERRIGYFLILIDFLAVVFGALLSWRKHKVERANLK